MSLMSTTLRSFVNRSLAPFGAPAAGQRFGSSEDLLAAAERRTGLINWGDPTFRGGLDALLSDLEELPDLTPLGVTTFGNMIRQALVNRLLFVGDSSPRSELNSPVIITGLPRSGTTALHRLLALDPVFHAPPLWELLDPFSSPNPDLRRWRTTAQISFKNRLLPDLDQKHFTRADTPEECTLLLANSFASSLFWDLAPLEGYLEWVQTADQRPVYEDYRRQLEILQARHASRRLLLKAPAHLGNLAVLHEVVPEAQLIQTHRDPTRCFFSHCSLRETLSSFVVDRPDREAIAGQVKRVFDHDLRGNLEFHRGAQGGVIHVACSTLAREPLQVRREISRRVGVDWTEEATNRAARPRREGGGPGLHRYSHDGWGISPSDVAGFFGDYRSTFADLVAT
jgi:hypothetical protein